MENMHKVITKIGEYFYPNDSNITFTNESFTFIYEEIKKELPHLELPNEEPCTLDSYYYKDLQIHYMNKQEGTYLFCIKYNNQTYLMKIQRYDDTSY